MTSRENPVRRDPSGNREFPGSLLRYRAGKSGSASDRAGASMKARHHFHNFLERIEEDGIYGGRCPDLITGISW
jgi:hypothetical protein